jgi:RimJ/RimL family protein N-acetyltransferase
VGQYRYRTDRLDVDGWHELPLADGSDLPNVLIDMLTAATTRALLLGWQGTYDRSRALNWIKERDDESATLLAVDRTTSAPIGLMILFEIPSPGLDGLLDIRLGYLLAEAAWGRGFGSEMVAGFVEWCRSSNSVRSIAGGVGADNPASARVLTKNGFKLAGTEDSGEQLYELIFG